MTFQYQISKVARSCVRKRGGEGDAEEDEVDPVRVRLHQGDSGLGDQLRQVEVEKDMEVDREDGNSTLRTGAPESGCGSQPEMIPAPDSPTLSVQLPTQQQSKVTSHPMEPSRARTRAPSQAPRADGTQHEKLSRGQLRDQCSLRGYQKKESKAA